MLPLLFVSLKKLYMWSMSYSYVPSCLFKTLQPCYDVNYSPDFCTTGKDRFVLFFHVVMNLIGLVSMYNWILLIVSMLSPLHASFLTTAFCCGMDIKKRMPEPSYNRVDCKSPKLRTKSTIFKESPKFATSQTCVSDLRQNILAPKTHKKPDSQDFVGYTQNEGIHVKIPQFFSNQSP